jgi:hypothetical protein
MFLDKLVLPFAKIHYYFSERRERQIGYRLILPKLSPHWIDGIMIFDMAPVWYKYRLNAKGVNYFTIGAVKNRLSSRFDEDSPYYQAWFGGYIVQFANPRDWTIDDHFELGVADQKNWLVYYGKYNPFVEVDKSSVKKLGKVRIGTLTGILYQGNIWSNTDVGDGKYFLPLQLLMAGGAHHFNKNNSNLNLTYKNFIPQWSGKYFLKPYQKILLKGYIALVKINKNTTALLYANGAEFTNKNSKRRDTFSVIKNELKNMMEKVKIEKLAS